MDKPASVGVGLDVEGVFVVACIGAVFDKPANAVGTYISTMDKNFYDEGMPYQYDVNGQTASALSEVVYENRLKPSTFSAGMYLRYKYTKNDYIGDASALTEMNQHNHSLQSE